MCWCSWLRIDAAWLQWISSKNYSINSAAVALDGISAGKSLSALPNLYYKWLPALLHQLLKPWGWTWSKARAPYPILFSRSYQYKIGWFIQGEKHLHKNINRCMWGLPDINFLPEVPKHWSFTLVHYSKSQVRLPGHLETFNVLKTVSPLQTVRIHQHQEYWKIKHLFISRTTILTESWKDKIEEKTNNRHGIYQNKCYWYMGN